MEAHFNNVKIRNRLITFPDGQQAVEYFKSLIEINKIRTTTKFYPVSLLILDINMPVLNGLQAAEKIRALYKTGNENLSGSKLMPPVIVFLTQLDFDHMRQLMYLNEEADIFLAKPLTTKNILDLLKLVKII